MCAPDPVYLLRECRQKQQWVIKKAIPYVYPNLLDTFLFVVLIQQTLWCFNLHVIPSSPTEIDVTEKKEKKKS